MLQALLPFVIVLPLLAFWALMLYDMVNNPDIMDSTLEPFRWPPQGKNYWFVAFVLLNIFAAVYYYFTVYRNK